MPTLQPNRRRKPKPPLLPDPRAARAAMLDRLADAELQHGHHLAAERLAWQAAELRAETGIYAVSAIHHAAQADARGRCRDEPS